MSTHPIPTTTTTNTNTATIQTNEHNNNNNNNNNNKNEINLSESILDNNSNNIINNTAPTNNATLNLTNNITTTTELFQYTNTRFTQLNNDLLFISQHITQPLQTALSSLTVVQQEELMRIMERQMSECGANEVKQMKKVRQLQIFNNLSKIE
jgi:hypothetical protein